MPLSISTDSRGREFNDGYGCVLYMGVFFIFQIKCQEIQKKIKGVGSRAQEGKLCLNTSKDISEGQEGRQQYLNIKRSLVVLVVKGHSLHLNPSLAFCSCLPVNTRELN